MGKESKLKPNYLPYILVPIIIFTFFIILKYNILGENTESIFFTILFAQATFNQCLIFIRTRNIHFIPFLLVYFYVFINHFLQWIGLESWSEAMNHFSFIPLLILVLREGFLPVQDKSGVLRIICSISYCCAS